MLSGRILRAQLFCAGLILLFASAASGASLTTTFTDNNGQAGNMFDVNVLHAGGVELDAIDLNLDGGLWNIEIYSRASGYAGFETNSAAWTLRDSVTDLVSAGRGNATAWDLTNFDLAGGAISALYVNITNGTGLNYTNGTTEGAIFAQDAFIQILEGTGNRSNFGGQFRPRIFNGTLHYTTVPEPNVSILMGLGLLGLASVRRRPIG